MVEVGTHVRHIWTDVKYRREFSAAGDRQQGPGLGRCRGQRLSEGSRSHACGPPGSLPGGDIEA